MNKAIGTKSGEISINGTSVDTGSLSAMNSIGNHRIEVTNLNGFCKEIGLCHAVLKVDCEGCEYGLFADDEWMMCFDQIVIEFHSGIHEIAKKLRNHDFDVKITWTSSSMGVIHAIRVGHKSPI